MSKPRLAKSRFLKPYNTDGSTNMAFCKSKAGVYLIKNETGDIVYIGFSATNLYKTVLRHFQSWDDNKQVRVSYPYKHTFTVRVVLTTPGRAEKLERALIVELKPKDNPDKLRKYTPTKSEYELEAEYQKSLARSIEEMEEAPF